MNKTRIEWCDVTLNPVVGCTYNCEYCYARKMNQRFGWVDDFHKPQYFPDRLKKLESKKPQVVFMNSLSDIADWKEQWIDETFSAIKQNPQHKYLFLTKRFDYFNAKYGRKIFKEVSKENVLIGSTITYQDDYDEAQYAPDFFSVEPILEEITFRSDRFQSSWVIIGAETGNRKDKVVPKKEWIDKIVSFCDSDSINVPVFMKNSLIPIVGEENMQREFPWQ